ncbi:COP1-interactive protein 1 isoform X2 [Phragmites australis]|uniref:COP1-interactive protein 1 isoform X2 n=1 Tax=Phragmites australis TaxID=29695 RepID=UPI002D79E5E3|nr:COP1-interactive protein 1 isoform X2 [Phragmites australis]
MDHRGGEGGGGGGNRNRTDLLAAGRKKLQQFRKKKEKRGPGKRAEGHADAEAEEGEAKAGAEAVPEPKSPVGLKLLAGESGSSRSTPFEEAERSQVEQCNGQGPGAMGSSPVENVDVVPGQEEGDDYEAHKVSTSEQGISERESSGPGDGEGPAIQAINGDDSGDLAEGAHLGEVCVDKKLPDWILKGNMELNTSSQGSGAGDDFNQLGEHQQVEMDPAGRSTSSDFKEVDEMPIPSQDIRADNTNDEEGAREMVMDVSGSPSDVIIQHDVDPIVSAEVDAETTHEEQLTVAASHEILESTARSDTNEEAEGVGKEAVQENPSTAHVTEEAITADDLIFQARSTGAVGMPLCEENVDPALFGTVVLQEIMTGHFENTQRHLYLITLSRDFLQLHLDEAAEMYSDFTQRSSDETTKLQVLLKETEESKLAVSKELHQCRHELSEVNTVRGELEAIIASLKEEINTSNLKCAHLEIELCSSKENTQQIQSELADSRSLLEAVQKENLELTASLAFEKEAKKEVEDQRDHLSSENKKLLSKLSELELGLVSMKEEMSASSSRCNVLECELCSSNENMEHTLTELANCRALLETFQKDNSELSANFASEKDVNRKLEEDNVYLCNEKDRLSSDLSELNDKLHLSYAKHKQLESHVKDVETYFGQLTEQLIEESLYSRSSVDIYQSVIKDLDTKYNVVPGQVQNVVHQESELHLKSPEENAERAITNPGLVGYGTNQCSLNLVNENDSCNSTALQSLKGHLEVAKGDLHDLEKLLERISSRSDGRVLVSKLIKSFESKGNEDDTGISEGEHDDLQKLTREMICRLGEKLMAMSSDLTKTEEYVSELCNIIELSINSAVQHDKDRQQTVVLEDKMDELAGKLSNYKDAIGNLHSQLAIVEQDANSNAGRLIDQAELLQKDVAERISILEKERMSLSNLLSEVTDKLSSLRGIAFPNDFSESKDLNFHGLNCVDLVATSFQSLQEKLEAAQNDNTQLSSSLTELKKANFVAQERSEQAYGIVKKLYNSLQELLCDSLKNSVEFGTGYNDEEPIESQYGRLIEHLKNLLHENHSILSTNADLESRLLSKCEEVEELNMRCSSLTKNMNDICILNEELKSTFLSKNAAQDELHSRCLAIAEKLVSHSANHSSTILPLMSDSGEVEGSSKEDHILTTFLPCIEECVASCIEKFEDAVEEIRLSKICLQGINTFDHISSDKWSSPLPTLIKEEIVPKLCDLQDRVDQLNALNIQLETEVPVLRDGLKTLGEALDTSRAELQKKVSELEQLDQKLSSVKEKLSIAVAKGKGLIVQRDSLKQSLLEKSGEVEKVTQELQSKEALLKEMEARLKSYTEADRIEALESELSYIRNSATALRDSFLLKDSVLQRIEEVLEDLELPEQFHSRDIVEKIELLSKMAVGVSFALSDGDKRSSIDGHSESGAAIDGINDEQNSNSNPVSNEVKNKYDELHRRFYELAEHNNMLEQSLVERNSLIQKWEEVLGQISIPPQFRMLEAEDKIAWLGNRLLEVEQERDSLQSKIEHLEDSSEMLIADLEESHKRISELSAEVVAIKAEKDFFSQSLEKLRFEFLGLSEKAIQDEFVRDNLRKDLSELQEKLDEKTESKKYHDMDIEINKLLNLVQDTLQDGSNSEIPSDATSAVLCLGKLLRKLLDEYGALLSKSTVSSFAEREIHLEETKSSNNASTSETGTYDKEMELNTLNNELDQARNSLALVEQQRNEAVEKVQSLMLEIETLQAQINKLQESGAEQMQKNHLLVLELESAGKQRDNLQEQLNQEEQRCASLREKLNVAVRKGKGLVQHRDSLKQTMEEMNAVIEKLKDERKQHIESLETEKSSLMGRLAENEKSLHDTNQYLSGLLNALNKVDIAREFDMDPITKVEKIAKFCLDLQATVVSSQNEVTKSKRVTELLLAELNEAHERADNLQEELVKAEAALSESYKRYNVIESARADAVRHLEHIMHVQSQTRRKQVDHLMELNSASSQLREVCFELSHCLVNTFSKDVDLIGHMESFMKSSGKWMDGAMIDIPIASKHALSNSMNSKAHIPNAPLEIKMDDTDERQLLHHLAIACHALSDCVNDCNDLKRSIDEHGFSVEQKATELFDVMSNLQNRFTSQHNELESLREKLVELQSEMKEKDDEIVSMRTNMSLLYEACTSSVAEVEGMTVIYPVNRSYVDCIKSIVEQLVVTVKTYRNSNEGSTKELKATVLELQQELQVKDVQISTISSELSSQLREAESSAKQLSVELEDARMELCNLEKQVDVLHNQKKALETQVNDLKDMEAVASEQHGRMKELTDELSRKDQEIEGLMQALDEEEKELEVLENKSHDLEQMLQEKEFALKSLEVSRTKSLGKLATTVDKFDELHSLSESLLAEVENLQSQLQERESEISFLRQEVTRSTNELLTTEESNKKYSSQINDFIKWLETALSQFGVHCESIDDYDCTHVPAYMDILDRKIVSLIAESDDLRVAVQSKDSLLQVERTRMEELMRKSEAQEASLSPKDSQIGLLRRDRTSSQPSKSINLPGTSEIVQMTDKVSPAAVVTQIRGARKVNSDQVAIDVEMENKPLDDEDDDKAHGFKSLTMSHFVPKFTRPISDRIDGMWVSGDRLLMRQPTLRLGVLIYWIALHALLASFI